MGHVYGYVRVSTKGQSLKIQKKDLKKAGCERIFSDKATGKNTKRPGFEKMMDAVLKGDTIVITKLDRIGRNVQELIGIVNELNEKGVGFKVVDNDKIDTTTSQGKLIFTIFAAVAEYERELIVERTEKGRKAAKDKGRTGGRKPTITQKQIAAVTKLAEDMPVKDACKQIGIARQSYYRLKATQAA